MFHSKIFNKFNTYIILKVHSMMAITSVFPVVLVYTYIPGSLDFCGFLRSVGGQRLEAKQIHP
jgi:hypothetical protein